jgi:peptide/nickel transport system permease protein
VAGSQSPTVTGFWPLVLDRLRHLALPTVALTVISYAGYHLLQRSLLLDDIGACCWTTSAPTTCGWHGPRG